MRKGLLATAVAWAAGLTMLTATSAVAQTTERDLWSFGSVYLYDDTPQNAPVMDANGNCFGANPNGGAHNVGYLWEYTANGQFIDLHDFSGGTDGQSPSGPLAIDGQGNVYGETQLGGASDFGTVFEFTANGTYSQLASMDPNSMGGYPQSGVVVDTNGDLFGTNLQGPGSDSFGSLWEIPSGGSFETISGFDSNGAAGAYPRSALAIDTNGNVYGSTASGGTNGAGTIWRWSPTNGFSAVYNLTGQDVMFSSIQGLAVDSVGNVYAILPASGANQAGQLAEFAPDGTETDLHDFSISDAMTWEPTRVALDASGNIYGISAQGGSNSCGYAWKVGGDGTFSTLFTFGSTSSSAQFPVDGPTITANGSMYGISQGGGAYGIGTLWSFVIPGPPVTSLTLSPSTVVGGNGATGRVTIDTPQSSNTLITLNWQPGAATAPATVTVPAGQTTASFAITTSPVATLENITFGAFGQGYRNFKLATITITAPTVTGLTLSPTTVTGGTSSTGTVTLSSPAPAGGLPVTLVSEYAFASVPASVTIPAGQTSGNFTITTSTVKTTSTDVIAALSGSSRAVASLTVTAIPPTVTKLTFSPATVTGGASATGTVTIGSPAPTPGLTVSLSSEYSFVTVPATMTIAPGQTSGTFTVTTKPVATTAAATISAANGSSRASAPVTVSAPTLVSVSLTTGSLVGGSSTTGKVTIGSAAPTGGLVIALLSSSGTVTVPSSVTIPAGATSVSFTVATKTVTATQSATIKASANGQTVTTPLTVTHS